MRIDIFIAMHAIFTMPILPRDRGLHVLLTVYELKTEVGARLRLLGTHCCVQYMHIHFGYQSYADLELLVL